MRRRLFLRGNAPLPNGGSEKTRTVSGAGWSGLEPELVCKVDCGIGNAYQKQYAAEPCSRRAWVEMHYLDLLFSSDHSRPLAVRDGVYQANA